MRQQPDYAALVAILPTLHRLVDTSGAVTLEPHEADRIRALGFHAQPGTWSVPPLPADLVAGNPLLEPLGDDVDHFWKPSLDESAEVPQVRTTREEAAESPGVVDVVSPGAGALNGSPSGSTATSPVSLEAKSPHDQAPDCTLEKECAAILEAVERAGGRIPKRLLQKKLWRIRAERFNQVIESLVERGEIHLDGNTLITQPVPQSDSNEFLGVPQPHEDVPRVKSAVGPEESAGSVNEIRGRASRNSSVRKVIENAD